MAVSKRNYRKSKSDQKTKAIVKKQLNNMGLIPETKFYVGENRDSTLALSGTWIGMVNGPAASANQQERVGNEIAIRKVTINFTIDRPNADLNSDLSIFQCKFAMVVDKQCNEAVPLCLVDAGSVNGSAAIYTGSTTAARGYGITAQRNPNTNSRFRILKEGSVNVGNNAMWELTSTGPDVYTMESTTSNVISLTHVFKKPLVVKFNDTAAGVDSIISNNLGMAFLPSTAESMGVSYTHMIHYTDC